MSRDLGAHDLFPLCADSMGESHTIETQIAQDFSDQIADGLESTLSTSAGTASTAPPVQRSSSPRR